MKIIEYKNFIIFLLILIFSSTIFFLGLDLNPKYSTKKMIKMEIPNFKTSTLESSDIFFSNKDILPGKFKIINIWSSWCEPCRREHKILMKLSKISNLDLFGINFKDSKKNANSFLNKYGNPFLKTGIDKKGILSIDFGAFGVPETFFIDKENKIISKYIGPLTQRDYKDIVAKINQNL